MSLMRMFSAGPEVSLNGSPTVFAYNGGLVSFRAFAVEVARLDVLLGVVPCAARVGHCHGQQETGGDCAL